jgi:hypothetical protein
LELRILKRARNGNFENVADGRLLADNIGQKTGKTRNYLTAGIEDLQANLGKP